MLTNNAADKYETSYNSPFLITQCCYHGMATIQCGPIQIKHHIRWMKPYKSDTNVEDIATLYMYGVVNI